MHERTSINMRVNAGWKYHPASRDTVYVDGGSYMLDTACSQPLRRRSEITLIVHVARIVLQVCKHVLRLIQLSLVIIYPSVGFDGYNVQPCSHQIQGRNHDLRHHNACRLELQFM